MATHRLTMSRERRDTTEDHTDVIVDWRLGGIDSQEHQETRCPLDVYQRIAVERMHQDGSQALTLPLAKLPTPKSAFTGVITAAAGQLPSVFATVARSTFTS